MSDMTAESPTSDSSADAATDASSRADASSNQSVPPAPNDANADVAQLGYEQARDELAQIVSTLEGGRAPLEESMRLWERGEALADHCTRWLDGAQTRIEEAVARREGRGEASHA